MALETGPHGKVSVEHVVNVLERSTAMAPLPRAATTPLALLAPLANTARCDSLRAANTTEEACHDDA